jgi:hypothetical protein
MSRLRRDSNFVDASNRWSAPMLQPNEPAKSARTPIWRHWMIRAANDRCVEPPVEPDCANYIPTALFSDAKIPRTEPRFVVGARTVIWSFATVLHQYTVSGASYPPNRPLTITQIPGRRPT